MMGKRKFKTELDYEIINRLLTLPLAQRRQELRQCDIQSLARAMAHRYSLADAKRMVKGLGPTIETEFIKAVRIYKGDLPYPSYIRTKIIVSKPRYWPPILASLILWLLIVLIDHLMP